MRKGARTVSNSRTPREGVVVHEGTAQRTSKSTQLSGYAWPDCQIVRLFFVLATIDNQIYL